MLQIFASATGKKMPVALIIGLEPSLPFCFGTGVARMVCEYDVAGAVPARR